MKIIYIKPYPGEAEIVTAALTGHDCLFAESIEEIAEADRAEAEVLSVFVNYEVTKEVLEALPKLQFIATRSAGFDHIDRTTAAARGVRICRVPHYGTRTVAEYAFALMFALSRHAFQSYIDMQRQSVVTELSGYEGFDLAGKTLGVIGTGAIGENTCQIGLGLGMQVIASDVHEKESLIEKGVTYVSLPTLMKQADIITIHVPSMPATHHLVGEAELALVKPTAYLINTARGEIVDTAALVRALKEGRLAGAGLDVLEGEQNFRDEVALFVENTVSDVDWATIVADHALIDMPNVIVTPHIAFNTKEAKREITDISIANIQSFANGEINEQNEIVS